MRYTAQSSKYVLKNFIYLFPFAILPALFLSLSTDSEAIYCALETIFSGKINEFHFSHLFRAISVLSFTSTKSILFGLFGIIAMVVCVAFLMAMLDKHMRIGKRTFTGIFAKLNDNLVSTCGYVLLILIIYELWTLVTTTLIYIFSRITVIWLAYTFTVLVYLAMHVLLIYMIGHIYLWLPCMQITGFRALEALRYSNHLMAPVKWIIMVKQLAILLFAEGVLALCSAFAFNFFTFTVVSTILYAVILITYCVRMMVAYFDREQIERADLRKYGRF